MHLRWLAPSTIRVELVFTYKVNLYSPYENGKLQYRSYVEWEVCKVIISQYSAILLKNKKHRAKGRDFCLHPKSVWNCGPFFGNIY